MCSVPVAMRGMEFATQYVLKFVLIKMPLMRWNEGKYV